MHFVNKLFANCCTPQKREFDRPAPLPPFPYQVKEQLLAKSMDNTSKARRRETRSALVHLRSLPLTQSATKIGQVLGHGLKLKLAWRQA
jgi:hypothetical protein